MASDDYGPRPKGDRRRPPGWFQELDRLLRGELTGVSSLRSGGIEISPWRLSACIIVLAMVYGACMGTFALFRMKVPSVNQVVASMVKVPLLFYLTLLVTLPSLYVFNALVGSRLTLVDGHPAAGGDPRRDGDDPGFAGHDRGLLLGEHDELSVHGALQRGGLRGLRRAGAHLLAPDLASLERRGDARRKSPAVTRPGSRRIRPKGSSRQGRGSVGGRWNPWRTGS